MRRAVVALACFLVSAGQNSLAGNGTVTFVAHGRSDGQAVTAVVTAMRYSDQIPYRELGVWWGTDMNQPQFIVSSLAVLRDGKPLFVGLSAYCDLAEPREVHIRVNNAGFDVVIDGSDAAGSYVAVLAFENGVLRRRRVTSGEFPAERWEETVYSFVGDDGR